LNVKFDPESPEVQFALEVIQFGAELATRVRIESSVKAIIKPDHSPVTLADMSIQAIAGALLEQYLPEAVLVAEEDADHLRAPEGTEDLEKVTGYVHSFFPHARPDRVCRWIERGNPNSPFKKLKVNWASPGSPHSEENGCQGGGKPLGSFWTLDPIDGTKGFLRGGQYATGLALIKDGQVELAAIGCPELELEAYKALGKGVGIFAVRGGGCRAFSLDDIEDPRRWIPLKVSACGETDKARVLDSFDPDHKNAEKDRRIREALGVRAEPAVLDSMAKQVVLASGGAEIFFRTLPKHRPGHREKIWDVAAGALAIEEAGGRVTDLNGEELDFSAGLTLARNPGFVATNGLLHEAVLEALEKVT
jgi:3'(2'), 5'-bisphosphate nucleotidase